MELTDLQMVSMILVAISLLGINVFIIQSKKLKKKTKLKLTLICTFTAYSLCVLIDMQIYSTVLDTSEMLVMSTNKLNI